MKGLKKIWIQLSSKGIVDLLKTFWFIVSSDSVCPAGWKPGDDTIKPGVKESKEFFGKQ